MGDAAAIARANRAEGPVVLAHRHRVQAGASVARTHRALANARQKVAQLLQLAPEHVMDLDEVLAGSGVFAHGRGDTTVEG